MLLRFSFFSALFLFLLRVGWAAQIPLNSVTRMQDVIDGKVFTPTSYSIVPGYFIQSSPDFNSSGYDLLSDSFGLIDKTSSGWQNLRAVLNKLNARADSQTTYKLIYIARHGQGWHNVAEQKYGTPEWNRYWSRINGDEEITWGPDPELTPVGNHQAKLVNLAWKEQIRRGVILPKRVFSSPLRRAAKTLEITWKDILIQPQQILPLIREDWRESIGLHTEFDLLWSRDFQESTRQQNLRMQRTLNQLFATETASVVSITAHGGQIAAFLRVVGHRPIQVGPGGFVPVIVKATSDPKAPSQIFAGGQSRHPNPLPTAKVTVNGIV